MQYFDPFPATCEHCGHRASYPLAPLEAGESYCESCGGLLVDTGRALRGGRRRHGIEIWPHLLMFELFCVFDLDFDWISDEDMEVQRLDQLVALVQRLRPELTTDQILAFEMLAPLRSLFTDAVLLSSELSSLAESVYPPETTGSVSRQQKTE